MGLISFFKNLFGKKKETKPSVVESPVVKTESSALKSEFAPDPKVKEPVNVIEKNLTEVTEKKEDKKVTAKDIKAKAKKKSTDKPATKNPVDKKTSDKKPVRKKADKSTNKK